MSTASPGSVGLVTAGTIATVQLNRPEKHNALTPEMLVDLERILIALDSDQSVHVVVLTGAGDRSFCAGADINRFKALPALDMWAYWTRLGQRVFNLLAHLRQPTIAAVHGNAYGGGFELALACDLRVVADDATMGFTEVHIGTLPGWGGTGRLRDLVGAGRAKELILTGEPIPAAAAHQWGVANRLATKGSVLPAALTLAETIRRQAPLAVQMAKQAIDSGLAYPVIEQLAATATAFTGDAAEGMASFQERRQPVFRGA